MRGANLYQCERQFFIEQKADELIEDVFFDAAWTRARRRGGHRVAIERRHARRHRKRSRVPHGWSHARRRLREAMNAIEALMNLKQRAEVIAREIRAEFILSRSNFCIRRYCKNIAIGVDEAFDGPTAIIRLTVFR
jgi:hypothetical protein